MASGDCDRVRKGDSYFWGWSRSPGDKYEIDFEPPGLAYDASGKAYSPYDTKGNHCSDLSAGSAAIPEEIWDKPHPELPGLTLRELAEMPLGTPICWHVGLNNIGFDRRYTFERLELLTHFDKDTMAKPESTVWVVFLHPNGTTLDKEEAWVMGAMPDAKTGAWGSFWTEAC